MSTKRRRSPQHAGPGSPASPAGASRLPLAAALVAIATLAVYARVHGFPFIHNFDDGLYVTRNPHVTGGLRADNVVWAFTHACAGNWHPLTMLSHMTDVS